MYTAVLLLVVLPPSAIILAKRNFILLSVLESISTALSSGYVCRK